jgi:tetratricopeptide (TPR) repeat protein
VVDFNVAGYRSDREQRVVDDRYVLSLFYNNLGAEALIRDDYETSFRYLRAALTAAPNVTDPWVNLGVLYRRQNHIAQAQAAYLHALASRPRDGSALSNLANLEAQLGNAAAAAHYREQIRRHQNRNPYYHYFQAREALDQRRLDDARAALQRARRLKSNEPAFDELRAQLSAALAQRPARAGEAAGDRWVRSVGEVGETTPTATP